MATLYKATYHIKKGLAYDYCSIDPIPETLDKPWHYLYSEWECIAEDFELNDWKTWNKIARSLHGFTIDLLNSVFVDPYHKQYPYPKHPIGTKCRTVFWLKENDKTIPPAKIKEIKKTYQKQHWEKIRKPWEQIYAEYENIPYRHHIRRPKTTQPIRNNLTPQECREIKDEYGICIPNLKPEVTIWNDICIPNYKSWKHNTKDKKSCDKHKIKTRRGHKLKHIKKEP